MAMVAPAAGGGHAVPMKAIRVRVENGRISGEAPPGFPEGEVDLCLAEPEDRMSDDELTRLNEALARGFDGFIERRSLVSGAS
jgi:hypothetical protein